MSIIRASSYLSVRSYYCYSVTITKKHKGQTTQYSFCNILDVVGSFAYTSPKFYFIVDNTFCHCCMDINITFNRYNFAFFIPSPQTGHYIRYFGFDISTHNNNQWEMYRCDKIPFSHHSPVSCELLNYMLLQYCNNFKHYL